MNGPTWNQITMQLDLQIELMTIALAVKTERRPSREADKEIVDRLERAMQRVCGNRTTTGVNWADARLMLAATCREALDVLGESETKGS